MRILDYIDKLKMLISLLKLERTGGITQIAAVMQIHRNTVYNYMSELRALGAEIEYDAKKKTFYLKKPFDIILTIKY